MAKLLHLQTIPSIEEYRRIKREVIKELTIDIKQDNNIVAIRLQKTTTMPNLLVFSEDLVRIYMAHKVQSKTKEVCKTQIGFYKIVDDKNNSSIEMSIDVAWRADPNNSNGPVVNIFLVSYIKPNRLMCHDTACSCCGELFDSENAPKLPYILKRIRLPPHKVNMVNLVNIFANLCSKFPPHLTNVKLAAVLLLKDFAKKWIEKNVIQDLKEQFFLQLHQQTLKK